MEKWFDAHTIYSIIFKLNYLMILIKISKKILIEEQTAALTKGASTD